MEIISSNHIAYMKPYGKKQVKQKRSTLVSLRNMKHLLGIRLFNDVIAALILFGCHMDRCHMCQFVGEYLVKKIGWSLPQRDPVQKFGGKKSSTEPEVFIVSNCNNGIIHF